MQALFYQPKVENYIMIGCEKKEQKESNNPYKTMVVHTYVLNFFKHLTPPPRDMITLEKWKHVSQMHHPFVWKGPTYAS